MSGHEGALRLLAGSVRGRGRQVRSVLWWSAVEALPAFLSGRLVAEALDRGFLAGRTAVGLGWLGLLALAMAVGAWGTRQTFLRLAALVEPFRDELVLHTVQGAIGRSTLPGAAADTAGVARMTQHVEIAREAYASVLIVVQGFVVTAVSALLGLSSVAPAALVLVLPPLVAGLGLFVAALPAMAARQRASIVADERVAEGAAALAGGLRDVVACGGEATVESRVGEEIDAQARATERLARLSAVQTTSVAVGGWLPVLLVLFASRWLQDRGATTGAIFGVLTYLLQGVHPALQQLVRGLGGTGLWLMVTLDRIAAGSSEAGPSHQAPGPDLTPSLRGHDLRLHRVGFRYGPSAAPVLEGLDLDVAEGDHLAVVGPSGAGKSTLANLMAGVLEPDSGEVSIGGVPMRHLDRRELARHRVLIPQEAYVFGGTLWENLAYLNPGVTPAEVDRAADRLGLRALVDRLGGYQARVPAGALSAGERQLLTLVRAYVAPAPIVILDEATCHLDPAAEARVELAFAQRPGTLVVIAHRVSSARRARRILVLDGTRVHLGSHEELLAASPLYSELFGRWTTLAPPDGRQNGGKTKGRHRASVRPNSTAATLTGANGTSLKALMARIGRAAAAALRYQQVGPGRRGRRPPRDPGPTPSP